MVVRARSHSGGRELAIWCNSELIESISRAASFSVRTNGGESTRLEPALTRTSTPNSSKLGSTGSVYEVHDRNLDINGALKFLKPGDGAGIGGPWDEARRLEQLESRFLLSVRNADVVESLDVRFIVTPVVALGDLEAAAADAGLALSDTRDVLAPPGRMDLVIRASFRRLSTS